MTPQTIYRAGSARRNITPREPVWLGGYGFRKAPFDGVISELYARALVLECGTERERSVIVSVDQVGVGRELAGTITARLSERFGIAPERVLLTFSHTHSGPVCDRTMGVIYPLNEEQWAAVERYGALLAREVEAAVEEAISALEPVELFFQQSVAGFGANRRRIRPGGAQWPAPVDHDVPVLSAVNAAGVVKAIVYGYACHTTTLALDSVSADYAGFSSEALETIWPEATALYIAGCGADINPLPRGTVELARHYGAILAAAVKEAIDDPLSRRVPLLQPLTIAREEITLPMEPPLTLEEWEELASGDEPFQRRWAQRWLERLRHGTPPGATFPYPIALWRFGTELNWWSLSGEVCVDYSLRLKAMTKEGACWVSAYSHQVNNGYIPSRRLLKEGGYEAGESNLYFDLPSRHYAPEVEEAIIAATQRLG